MAEEQPFQIEVDEEDIAYYLVDEDGNEIGFALTEDGKTVEYFYADSSDFTDDQSREGESLPPTEQPFQIEVDEEDIAYYLVDEDGNEIGFALTEDGKTVEYFYAEDSELPARSDKAQGVDESAVPEESKRPERSGGLPISKEKIMETAVDLGAIYRDSTEVIGDLKSTFDSFTKDLGIKPRPNRRRNRR